MRLDFLTRTTLQPLFVLFTIATLYDHMFMCVGLFVHSAVVFHFSCFFHVFFMFYVGLLMCGCVL